MPERQSDPPAETPQVPVFPRLFSSVEIGSILLKNRIVHTATLMGFAVDGLPTQRHLDFYAQLASGGTGLIVSESMPVHPTGISLNAEIHAFNPNVVPGLRRISQAVHSSGAAIIAQIWHCGRQAVSTASGRALWAPSALPCPFNREVPKAVTLDEIAELVEAFAVAAAHAQLAGFDGVEVAAAHGYLIHQFLSPLSNIREDAYGGSVENRERLLFEIVDAIRARCSRKFLVSVRLSADEFLPGGFTVHDTRQLVQRLSDRREVDLLSISAGTHASVGPMVGDWSVPRGNLVHLAGAIREVASGTPIVAVGRIVEAAQAEEILESGQADLIGLSRALLADPFWPSKARHGRPDEIRPCIACNECENQLFKGAAVTCAVNPLPTPVPTGGGAPAAPGWTRRVIVVGGGPAGLEAARSAALRRHRVSLFEAESELGGQLRQLRSIPNRHEVGEIVRFLTNELVRLGVEVQLERHMNASDVLALDADAIIVATGAVAAPFRIPGTGLPVLTIEEAITSSRDLGERLLLLDAGAHHQRLLAAAEYLCTAQRTLHIVTPATALGLDVSPTSLVGIMGRLRPSAYFWPLSTVREVHAGSVVMEDIPSGRRWELTDVDGVVVAGIPCASDQLFHELRQRLPLALSAGDCIAPRGIQQAIYEGRVAGSAV
jgi:2,4-dienoyl-CoA reductase-like NADH-dependent reductase (Old Yellow Enzyme family)